MNLISKAEQTTDIQVITTEDYPQWLNQQSQHVQNWLDCCKFKAQSGAYCVIPNEQGNCDKVVLVQQDADDFWAFAALASKLPAGSYAIPSDISLEQRTLAALAFGFGCYTFTRYKTATHSYDATLVVGEDVDLDSVTNIIDSFSLARDLINTPAQDMGPQHLAEEIKKVADTYHADFDEIVGDELLKNNFESIHTVGRGSAEAYKSRLCMLEWGDKNHPTVCLVGKGVCFDTGGLDLKSAAGMLPMKKDMGGAAHALAFARLIMSHQLPVHLRLFIPTVVNAVGSRAYSPGDIIKTRAGKTVEVLNTDAEGRLILCDALAKACEDKPDLLIDFATLTGAARVALGSDISCMYSSNDDVSKNIMEISQDISDPIWPMPLYMPYKRLLQSPIADLANCVIKSPYGGSITAALFLSEFVDNNIDWLHFDIFASNPEALLGRPKGGDVECLRTLLCYVKDRFK